MRLGKYTVYDKRDQTESTEYVIGRKIGTKNWACPMLKICLMIQAGTEKSL